MAEDHYLERASPPEAASWAGAHERESIGQDKLLEMHFLRETRAANDSTSGSLCVRILKF